MLGVHCMRRYRRWRAALCRAMSWLSTTKANHLTPGTSVALIVSRTSSVTRRLDHVDLHRFRARGPDDGNNRRLGISLRDSEVLTEGNAKCLLQCGRLRAFKRQASLPLTHTIHKHTHLCVHIHGVRDDARRQMPSHLHVVAHRHFTLSHGQEP